MEDKIEKIIKILWGIEEKDREDFLKVLFTNKEINDFSDRIDILLRLKKGDSQRKISSEVGVSITTVTRGNKFYKKNREVVDKYIK